MRPPEIIKVSGCNPAEFSRLNAPVEPIKGFLVAGSRVPHAIYRVRGACPSPERIVPARMKWVAFEEPDECQVSPFEYAISLEGVAGIGRACGIKATGRRPKR